MGISRNPEEVSAPAKAATPQVTGVGPIPASLTIQIVAITLVIMGLILASALPLNLARARTAARLLQAAPGSNAQAEQAIEMLSQLQRESPSDTTILLQLAEAYRIADQPEKELVVLQDAYRSQPQSVLIQRRLAEAYERADSFDTANAIWAGLGGGATHFLNLGRSCTSQGDYQGALVWYDRAIRAGINVDDQALQVELARVAALAQAPIPQSIQPYLEGLTRPVGPSLVINGGDLIWMPMQASRDHIYGKPLNAFPSGTLEPGVFWWDDEAGAFIQVDTAGDYTIIIHAIHRASEAGQLAVMIDAPTLQVLSVSPDWQEYHLSASLDPGIHLIRLRYVSGTGDMIVQTVTIQPVIK